MSYTMDSGISTVILNFMGILFYPEDVGTTTHPVLARLAATSGTNDVRDFWKVMDVPIVSQTEIDAVTNFGFNL